MKTEITQSTNSPDNLMPWQIEPAFWQQFQLTSSVLINDDSICITKPTLNQVDQIVDLLAGEQALVPVNVQDVVTATSLDLNLVALDANTSQIVGYQALGLWTDLNLVELRSAKVAESYQGKGINTIMKKIAIQIGLTKYPEMTIIAFTEALSKSRGILARLGFTEKPMPEVKDQWSGLSTLCPGECYIKTGHDCGCKVFVLNINE